MKWVPVHDVGKYGVIKDVDDFALPPEAWSIAQNVRFRDNAAEKMKGYEEPFGAAQTAPHFLLPVHTSLNSYWLYCGLTKAYVMQGSTHKDITRASGDYNADADAPWTGALIGGVPILNNPGDYPQMWKPIDFSTPQLLQNLTNWPVNTYARSVRAFKRFLIAVNITENSINYPQLVRWSHPADPGTVPSSWDPADATKNTGSVPLSDTSGHLVDQLRFGDANVLYTDSSIHGMQHIGGQYVFRFFDIAPYPGPGLLCVNGVANWRKGQAFIGLDDLYTHSLSQPESIGDKRMRRYFFNDMENSKSNRCFALRHPYTGEIWFCYPESGADYCTKALVWNWTDNIMGFRDLPSLAHAYAGIYEPDANPTVWDDVNETWDSKMEPWDVRTYGSVVQEVVGASVVTGDNGIYHFEATDLDNGSSPDVVLERTGLAVAGQDRMGNPRVNPNVRKTCQGVRPRFEGTGSVDVYLGAADDPEGPYTWVGPKSFSIGTDKQADLECSGFYLGVRFKSNGNQTWKLRGYDLLLEADGEY